LGEVGAAGLTQALFIVTHVIAHLTAAILLGSVLGALPCGAETISSSSEQKNQASTTTRSNPNGSPKKVVKAPPPPPETLIVVPATSTNTQPQDQQR
jgi:hypothetical protein